MKNQITGLLFSCLLFGGFFADAQNFALGFQGGIRHAELGRPDASPIVLNTQLDSRIGQQAAIFAEFKISNFISLKPMIEYSSQGGKKLGLQGFATPDAIAASYQPGQAPQVLYANYNSELKLNYVMVPLLAKFRFESPKFPLDFYVDAGPFVGFLLSADQVNNGQSQMYTDMSLQHPVPGGPQSFNNTQNVKDQFNAFNIGLESALGISYHFGPNRLFIEGGANFGVMDVQKTDINGKNEASSTTVAIGYSYRFHK